MLVCDNCLHDKVCGKCAATGGHVKECEYLMDNYTATEMAYKNGYEDGKKKNRLVPCHMCDNARLNDELTDSDDFSSCTIGSFDRDCRIMLTSGWGKPLRIEIARWNDNVKRWEDIGIYYPKFCPECGREIVEYKK